MIIKRSMKGLLAGIISFFVITIMGAVLMKLTPIPESWGFGIVISAISVTSFITSFCISGGSVKTGLITAIIIPVIIVLIPFI